MSHALGWPQLGVCNGKLHYCMKALMDERLVKLGNFANSRHHLEYAYLLTPAGIARKAAMGSTFLARKVAEYGTLRAEIEALTGQVTSQAAVSLSLRGPAEK